MARLSFLSHPRGEAPRVLATREVTVKPNSSGFFLAVIRNNGVFIPLPDDQPAVFDMHLCTDGYGQCPDACVNNHSAGVRGGCRKHVPILLTHKVVNIGLFTRRCSNDSPRLVHFDGGECLLFSVRNIPQVLAKRTPLALTDVLGSVEGWEERIVVGLGWKGQRKRLRHQAVDLDLMAVVMVEQGMYRCRLLMCHLRRQKTSFDSDLSLSPSGA